MDTGDITQNIQADENANN